MITYEEARGKVLVALHSRGVGGKAGVVVLDAEIIVKPYGWIFFYNSRRFVETGDLVHSLIGGGPVVVVAATGELVELGATRPEKEEIQNFERRRGFSLRSISNMGWDAALWKPPAPQGLGD